MLSSDSRSSPAEECLFLARDTALLNSAWRHLKFASSTYESVQEVLLFPFKAEIFDSLSTIKASTSTLWSTLSRYLRFSDLHTYIFRSFSYRSCSKRPVIICQITGPPVYLWSGFYPQSWCFLQPQDCLGENQLCASNLNYLLVHICSLVINNPIWGMSCR